MIRLILIWTGCLFLFPLLMLQGGWVRKRMVRLAGGLLLHTGNMGDGERALQIVGDGYYPGEAACEMVATEIVDKYLRKELILAHES